MAVEFIGDIDQVIIDSIQEVEPNADLSDGTALADFFRKPLKLLLEAFQREQDRLTTQRSIINFATLDEDQMDALAANFYVFRLQGDFAVGSVRIFFDTARTITVPQATFFVAKNGSEFNPVSTITITQSQMAINIDRGRFYIDVNIRAVEEGEESRVLAGEIISISNDQLGALSVTNLNDLTGGRVRETNEELFNRIKKSLGERSLVRGTAIEGVIAELFSPKRLFIAGFLDRNSYGNVIVQRDIIGNVVGPNTVFEHYGGKPDIFIKPNTLSDQTATLDLSDTTLFPRTPTGLRNASVEAANDAFIIPLSGAVMPMLPMVQIDSVCVSQTTFVDGTSCSNNILNDNDYFIISPSNGPIAPTVTQPAPTQPNQVAAKNDIANLRFSAAETPSLVIFKSVIGGTITVNPFTQNWLVRVKYKSSPLISEIQSFVSSTANRTLTDDPIVKHFMPLFLDANIQVSGTNLDMSALTSILRDEIYNDRVKEVSDIVDVLYENGVIRVALPITVTIRAPRIDAYIDTSFVNNPFSYVTTFTTQDNISEGLSPLNLNHIDLATTHTLMPGNITITLI